MNHVSLAIREALTLALFISYTVLLFLLSILKIVAFSASFYCFCNKISHIIAITDHPHFIQYIHMWFSVPVASTVSFCGTIKGWLSTSCVFVCVCIHACLCETLRVGWGLYAYCFWLLLFFRMPSRVENALLICLSNIIFSLHIFFFFLSQDDSVCQRISTWSHTWEQQKPPWQRHKTLVKIKKSGCSVRSSFVLGEFSSIEKKEIYIKISQCCKNQFALKK